MPNQFKAEKLSIRSFKIINEKISVPEFFDEDIIKEFTSTNSIAISFNLEQKLIRAEIEIEINSESDNSEEACASYKFVLIYFCENFEELVNTEGEKLKVNANLGISINAITYSTIRGVLLIKLSETVLNGFVLPIIKPSLQD